MEAKIVAGPLGRSGADITRIRDRQLHQARAAAEASPVYTVCTPASGVWLGAV